MMLKLLCAMAGGAVGTGLRFGVYRLTLSYRVADRAFPLGTLVVNLVGCLLIGFVGAMIAGKVIVREEWRLAIMTGVLGGLTTFSAFSFDTMELWRAGHPRMAIVNILLNNVLGLALVVLGFWLGGRMVGSSG